jgi:peptidoglycan-N-acetylmuramic acid deacetylase
MKLRKFAVMLCAVLAAVFAFCGCVDRNADNNDGNRSGTTTSATLRTADKDVTDDNNGDYEAGRDGIVSEDDDNKDTPADTSGTEMTGSTSDTTGSMPVVSGTSLKKDEAAFASSYMDLMALKSGKICWGLGKERDEKNRPIDAVRAQEKYEYLGGVFLAPEGKICLTFDEGYENGYTAAILDTLREKNVKAIFFVTYDYCRTAPELVRRMIDEGHIVGNHTWSHPSLPDCTQKEVWAEVTKLHEYVLREFGYEMMLFRFPKGEFSEQTLDDVGCLGYKSLFWSFAYADWDTGKAADPAEALAKIEASTHSGIYLLHAVSPTNAEILGDLLDYWAEKGYSVGAEF